MSKFKKVLALLLISSIFLSSFGTVFATEQVTIGPFSVGKQAVNATVGEENQDKLDLQAKSAVLMEGSTGRVLYQKDADKKLPPASITKVMTLLLVMEAIEKGTIKLEDKVNISEHAMSMGGSQIWLKPGEDFNVDQLLKATAIASANDASVALAEHVAGSHEGFVDLMNKRAKQLGMRNTNFVNATGLDAEGHLTTAMDIAIMSRELMKHKYVLKYTTTWMDSLRDGKTELVNTNKLVRFYKGCTGLKTGTTNGAGSCLSATAQRDGLELVAVVMGSDTSDQRFNSAKKLLDYGFAKYQMADVPKLEGDQYHTLAVKKGVEDKVGLEYQAAQKVVIPKGKEKTLECEVQLSENVTAPVEQGQILGKMVVKVDKKVIGEYKITAKEEVRQMSYSNAFQKLLSSLLKNK